MSDIKYNKEELYNIPLITIYTESNPNPNSMKFMLNFMLIKDGGSIDFPDVDSAKTSPLAQELFGFDFVKRVFYMNNFVTITKDESVEWIDVVPQLKGFIKQYFEDKKPLFTEDQAETIVETTDSEVIAKIKGILDEYIKPAVEMDGGAIQFDSFDEESGNLKVLLQGSCSGCPSSTITLKQGIQNLMQRMVPQVKEVVAEGV